MNNCKQCNTPLKRKMYEEAYRFKARKFCNTTCANRYNSLENHTRKE